MRRSNSHLLRILFLAILVAVGVVISPILRVEGMCPMAHLINIVCAVFLGPWYALLCAFLIGVIRMTIMGIPPLALTGAIFGAFLSGFLYRLSKGKLIAAFIGEVIGTGVIGAIISYPVMTLLWGYKGLTWMFYVPSFTMGTLIGGSIAYLFLKKLASSGMLTTIQESLGSAVYASNAASPASNAVAILALGMICFMALRVLSGAVAAGAVFWPYVTYGALIVFAIAAAVSFIKNSKKGTEAK